MVSHQSRLDLTSHHTRGAFSQDSCFLGVVQGVRWLGPNGKSTVFAGCGLVAILPFGETSSLKTFGRVLPPRTLPAHGLREARPDSIKNERVCRVHLHEAS